MRKFDYTRLPRQLFEGAAGDAIARLHEDKGKLELLKQLQPEALNALRAQAHFDNVDASTRIEGLYIDPARTHAVLAGAKASGEIESQVAGYSEALGLVESDADALDLSTASILRFYEALFGYRNLGRKSRYRKKDYIYVQVDGHPQAMPVSPIAAFETPLVLGGACDSLGEAFSAQACSPLVLNAVFAVDFLCIRPFEEGNGRISRLFADLMLEKAGFDICRYVSVDRIIEANAMDYYNALNACVEGWDTGANDYEPFVLYWLGIVHAAYGKLFALVEQRAASAASSKGDRVRAFVQQAGRPVAKREIRAALTDVSEATIENALGELVREGLVEKLGASRATTYRWL